MNYTIRVIQWALGPALFIGLSSLGCLGQNRSCQVLGLRAAGPVPLASVKVTLLYREPARDTTFYTNDKGQFTYPTRNLKLLDSVRLEKKSYRPQQEKAHIHVAELYLTSSQIFKSSYQQRAERLHKIQQEIGRKQTGIDCYEPLRRSGEQINKKLLVGQDSLLTDGMEWREHEQLRHTLDQELAELQLQLELIETQTYRPVEPLPIEHATATVRSRSQLGISFRVRGSSDCFHRRYPIRVSVFTTDKKSRLYLIDSLSKEVERQYWLSPATVDTTLVFRVNPKRSPAFNRKKKYTVFVTTLSSSDTLAQIQTEPAAEPAPAARLARQKQPPAPKSKPPVAYPVIKSARLGRSIQPVQEVRLPDANCWLHIRFAALTQEVARQKAYIPSVQLYVYADEKTDTLYVQRHNDQADIRLASVLLTKQSRNLITFFPDSLAPVQTIEIAVKNNRNRTLLQRQLAVEPKGVVYGLYILSPAKP